MTYNIVEPLDHPSILKEYLSLEKDIKWTNYGQSTGRQASLQHASGMQGGEGKLKQGVDEKEYNILVPGCEGTIFEELIVRYKLFRTRLMWVSGKSCYSIHKDRTKRLHIPIVTNTQCMFLFPDGPSLVHLPAGHSYIVDTTKNHTFCNFSEIDRLHLVGCID